MPYLISSTGVTPKTFNPDPITNSDGLYQREARARELFLAPRRRSAGRLLAPAIPVRMEGGGEVVEIEGDAVWSRRRAASMVRGHCAMRRTIASFTGSVMIERRFGEPLSVAMPAAAPGASPIGCARGHTGHTKPGCRATVRWPSPGRSRTARRSCASAWWKRTTSGPTSSRRSRQVTKTGTLDMPHQLAVAAHARAGRAFTSRVPGPP